MIYHLLPYIFPSFYQTKACARKEKTTRRGGKHNRRQK